MIYQYCWNQVILSVIFQNLIFLSFTFRPAVYLVIFVYMVWGKDQAFFFPIKLSDWLIIIYWNEYTFLTLKYPSLYAGQFLDSVLLLREGGDSILSIAHLSIFVPRLHHLDNVALSIFISNSFNIITWFSLFRVLLASFAHLPFNKNATISLLFSDKRKKSHALIGIVLNLSLCNDLTSL